MHTPAPFGLPRESLRARMNRALRCLAAFR